MMLTMPNSERLLPPLEILNEALRDGDLLAMAGVEGALAEMSDEDFATVVAAVAAGWGGKRVAAALEVAKHDRQGQSSVIAFPAPQSVKAAKLEAFFDGAEKTMEGAADALMAMLEPLTYEELVQVSDRSCEVFAMPQFVKDVITDEFGRRHQQMYPDVYPPDGAA